MSDEKNITLEEHFSNLEDIITRMENQETSLDDSFNLYKAGLQELKEANEMIDKVEKAMLVLSQDGGLEEF